MFTKFWRELCKTLQGNLAERVPPDAWIITYHWKPEKTVVVSNVDEVMRLMALPSVSIQPVVFAGPPTKLGEGHGGSKL